MCLTYPLVATGGKIQLGRNGKLAPADEAPQGLKTLISVTFVILFDVIEFQNIPFHTSLIVVLRIFGEPLCQTLCRVYQKGYSYFI